MSTVNDHIIERVFQAILQQLGGQSPEATFYNSMKMANMPVDNRMLANFIIQDFPWPIGVELRRLFSGSRKDRDKNRVEQILRAAERSAQFFCFSLLVQLWDESKSREIELSDDFRAQIAGFDRPSFGVYVGLIRATHALIERNKIPPFFDYSRDPDFKFSTLLKTMNDLVSRRNADRHQGGELDCEEAESMLADLLEQMAFLARYKMVTIKEIQVLHPKLKPIKYQHVMKMLNSQHEDFSALEQIYDDFSESHSVLLMKDFVTPKQYINLSPFVVDTGTLLGEQRMAGVKNGIYLFQNYDKGKYRYALTNAPETATFNDLPNFEDIEGQFDDFRQTVG